MLVSTLVLAAASALAAPTETPAPIFTAVLKDAQNDYATFEVDSDDSVSARKVATTMTELYGLREVLCSPIPTSSKTIKCAIAKKQGLPWFTKYQILCPSATPSDCNLNSAVSHKGKPVYFRGFTFFRSGNGQYVAAESNASEQDTTKIAEEMTHLYSEKGASCTATGPNLTCSSENGPVPFQRIRASCAYASKDDEIPYDCVAIDGYMSSHYYSV